MAKTRFAVITTVFAALSILYLCYGMPVAAQRLRVVLKGLPIALLFFSTCIWGRKHPCVIAALFFSYLGDSAGSMDLPGEWSFRLMVIFFGIAQIFYISEFVRYRSGTKLSNGNAYSLIPLFCSLYAIVLLGNLITSSMQKRDHKKVFVTGSILFVISDSMILMRMLMPGHNKFFGPAIMITYYLAQYLLNILVICEDHSAGK